MPNHTKRLVRNVAAAPIRTGLNLWWKSGLARLGLCKDRRRVLLCPSDELMAEYLRDIARMLADDSRISLSLTAPRRRLFNDHFGRRTAAKLHMPYVNYVRARAMRWDLILFADLAAAGRFDPVSPKFMFYHSISGGKILGGGQYRYGKGAMRGDAPLFTRMFESSHRMRELAIQQNPKLAEVIAVVGDLRWDKALQLKTQRDAIRREMGFGPGDTVILIQSTWGADSLMETIGPTLIDQAARMARDGKYKFILSTHPRHWFGTYAQDHPWGQFLLRQRERGFFAAEPSVPWEKLHTASDLTVTDYTGLCVAYTLQDKPMLFVPMREGVVAPTSYEYRLYDLAPHIEQTESLRPIVEAAMTDYPMDKLHEVMHDINAYPGEAEQRIRAELYNMLALTPPTDKGPS